MRIKDSLSQEGLRQALLHLNYENMNIAQVERPGQFSVRGGVVDVWVERFGSPARLDFFGNRVEAIYLFDPLTHQPQRNLKQIDIIRYSFTDSAKIKWPKQALSKFERLLLSDIRPGDLVVHLDHGIGRFLRVEERNLEGKPRYYLIVEYAKGEKLYVPVQQIDRLSKYIGVKGYRPRLNYLGTATWEKTKREVSQNLLGQAKALLRLYAARATVKRSPYPPDSAWQRELEQSFEFELTPSQEEALAEIKFDLESSTPMDRLLVGDVGFGKTELSLRAAFKVIQGGRQVFVLAPTSILAEQHFLTFSSRLARFPVKVRLLTKLQAYSEQRQIVDEVNKGEVEIVIGTHRLLSADVSPDKLGFLIIDEEHRFGVLHKEKLKQSRASLDVLSLSATPIPRSLHLALTKLRDLSLLSDPPEGRLPISNYIGTYQSSVVKQAIEQEISRGGQVYLLHNRVQSLAYEAKRVQALVPGAKVGYLHAQLPEDRIESTLHAFLNQEINVLVCSIIIGSGLDIPNANTLIVKDAHRLGLADLYQLRGRVGRSYRQAYAYFFYPQGYLPWGVARDRLEALSEASELGAGLSLAERDLEIRGAGNILGVEQHGNVSLVGFELYLKLLGDTVERLQHSS